MGEMRIQNKKEATPGKATHEEICDFALKDYRRISKEACEWNSVIEKAIKFYKQFGKERFRILK